MNFIYYRNNKDIRKLRNVLEDIIQVPLSNSPVKECSYFKIKFNMCLKKKKTKNNTILTATLVNRESFGFCTVKW